jgi:Flp pilus assembly protein TadG
MSGAGPQTLNLSLRDPMHRRGRGARFLERVKRAGGREDGASAVEFAIIAPLFIFIVFGIIVYGVVLASYISVQQLAAEAARASVGGLNATERTELAENYVTQNLAAYPLFDPNYLTVATDPQANTFRVTVTYDMAHNPVFRLVGGIPLPATKVTGNAVVQNGGY